jgi:bacterial/archaeal transporter family-2 protein
MPNVTMSLKRPPGVCDNGGDPITAKSPMAYLLLAFIIGCAIPLQAAINNQLRFHLGASTLLAAFVSFAVGTAALAAIVTVTGTRWSTIGGLSQARGWQLTGGLLGAVFVFGTTFLAPRIGVAKMLSLLIAGQVIVSLLLDHQGWVGLAVREVTPIRAAGAALVVAGAVLVNFDQIFGR